MRSNLVLTLIGDDRPGLVEAVSQAVAKHGGNWEESRMAHLAGKFAGLLRVSLATDRLPELETALGKLANSGLRIVVEESVPAPASEDFRRLRLELLGSDREGIVRDLAHALASRAINVEELQTSCEDAPMGGGQIFRATALLGVPGELSTDALRSTLEALADDLMVDVSLAELDRGKAG